MIIRDVHTPLPILTICSFRIFTLNGLTTLVVVVISDIVVLFLSHSHHYDDVTPIVHTKNIISFKHTCTLYSPLKLFTMWGEGVVGQINNSHTMQTHSHGRSLWEHDPLDFGSEVSFKSIANGKRSIQKSEKYMHFCD